jgi:hypothetical protein
MRRKEHISGQTGRLKRPLLNAVEKQNRNQLVGLQF